MDILWILSSTDTPWQSLAVTQYDCFTSCILKSCAGTPTASSPPRKQRNDFNLLKYQRKKNKVDLIIEQKEFRESSSFRDSQTVKGSAMKFMVMLKYF